MVFALAGDSTTTRLSAMRQRVPARSVPDNAAGRRHDALEAGERQLLSRLAGKDEEHHPLQLLDVGLVDVQSLRALDDELALPSREDMLAVEQHEEGAAVGRQPRQLAIGENAQSSATLAILRQDVRGLRPCALIAYQGRQPFHRVHDLAHREASLLQVR